MAMQKIVPYLWFDTEAAAAARLYTSGFLKSFLQTNNAQIEGILEDPFF